MGTRSGAAVIHRHTIAGRIVAVNDQLLRDVLGDWEARLVVSRGTRAERKTGLLRPAASTILVA